jgi:predicted glycogen debranching enzyme
VFALQKAGDVTDVSISIGSRDLESLLAREWLLTNGRGGYASSTIAGCNTRGYHGLLIGSLTPPVNRIMALSACLETVLCGQEAFSLSTFEFPGKIPSAGIDSLKRFRRDIGVHFDYELDTVGVTKSVYLLRDTDMVAVAYDFGRVQEPVELIVRPLVGLRDFHGRQKSDAAFRSSRRGPTGDGVLVRYEKPGDCSLLLKCPAAHFEEDPQWWFNFLYRAERERGLDFTEDLWAPGIFRCRIDAPTKIVLWASLHPYEPGEESAELEHINIDTVCRDLHKHQQDLLDSQCQTSDAPPCGTAKAKGFGDGRDRASRMLCLAADQFVAKRRINNRWETTILAGYPWFADWGRDALISLPGLLLMTGRFEEAKSVLSTFAAAADQGMIPNRFDDSSGPAHFNSVDASLWFINAAFEYLQATGDSKTFAQELLPTIRWIIDSYRRGTRFGIHADADGLITAGDENTQLTWMDAKCDGIAFTPRHGKAVEVNALWYNALMLMKNLVDSGGAEPHPALAMADRVKEAFCQLFWNKDEGYLNDCILPDGTADERLRPNQIFAVSLKFSPLSRKRQAAVVKVVQERLLTPYGLRTLPADAPGYKGRYAGPPRQRDEAYHQGTVWPYLMGPFVEAYLKVHQFSPGSRRQAAEFIEPLLRHLTEDGCIGSISEIFDADPPHKPKGCIAQAWSVAELIRAYHLINGPSARRERRGPH